MRRWIERFGFLGGLAAFGAVDAHAFWPKASSEGTTTEHGKHPASHAFDGLLSTGWAEGALGDGQGEWIELRFAQPVDLRSVSLWSGWLGERNRTIREYGRVRGVTLTATLASGDPVVVSDRLVDPNERGPYRHDIAIAAEGARSLRVAIDDAWAGGIYDQTFLAEIALNFVEGDKPTSVERAMAWPQGGGKRSEDRQRQTAIDRFDRIHAAEFGDREASADLLTWAFDGSPYMRERVRQTVPMGFRVSALPPDPTSVEALLKLKDANAIPAIERAALRSIGADAADLKRRARLFSAHQELTGGVGRHAVPWAERGHMKGFLRGFGEPLPVIVDPNGDIVVADVGNHRVQRFATGTGLVDKVWGIGEPGISDAWFSKTREPYASGSTPTEEAGGFRHPVALANGQHPLRETLWVLDAAGWLSRIDGSDEVTQIARVSSGAPISGGAGGEAHLVRAKKGVVAIWGNEAVVVDPKLGTELARFRIEDGVPSAAVSLGGSKIGLVFGRQLVLYSLDGFRHGDVMEGALGEGFQDWDITRDEAGGLWALIDTGEVIKLKAPGKVEFRVRVTPSELTTPRFAVYDGRLYITTADDKILRADAYELRAEQLGGDVGSDLGLSGEGS